MKKIKAWIEIATDVRIYSTPTLWHKKPLKREIENAKEFGYEIYKCELTYDNKKPL
jgi:hypothetical protein